MADRVGGGGHPGGHGRRADGAAPVQPTDLDVRRGTLLALEHLASSSRVSRSWTSTYSCGSSSGSCASSWTERWIDLRTRAGPTSDGERPGALSALAAVALRGGIAFGAAVAVKWSGSSALLAAIVICARVGDHEARARGIPRRSRVLACSPQEGFALVVAFVLLPIAICVVGVPAVAPPLPLAVGELVDQQIRIAKYHPSSSARWPRMHRPARSQPTTRTRRGAGS